MISLWGCLFVTISYSKWTRRPEKGQERSLAEQIRFLDEMPMIYLLRGFEVMERKEMED